MCLADAERHEKSSSSESLSPSYIISHFSSCIQYIMYCVCVCVCGLCSVTDGPLTGSEGVIRNPAHPGVRYDNNQ